MIPRSIRSVILLTLASVLPALADEGAKTGKAEKPAETVIETTHTVKVEGRSLAYRALAGELTIPDAAGKPSARMSYIAYLHEGTGERGRRPLTFVWNGGPGSSSVWLHLGAFGPKRVESDQDGMPSPPPYRLIPNEHTLLDVTDLVFVDPVSTGFSKPAEGVEAKRFHTVEGDVESVGEFVRLFVTRHGRWGSPVFLAGESYGTVRAAGVADYLQRRHQLYLNGVVLISPALNMQTYRLDDNNDLPLILALPSYTAAAWYHKKLAPELQADLGRAVREAEDFAYGDYDDALLRGASLSPERRKEIAARFSRLTGIPADEVERRNLRVGRYAFAELLLKAERRQIGLLDGRYWGYPNWMPVESFAPYYGYGLTDPASSRVDGLFGAAMNQYLRDDLGVRSEEGYEILSIPVAVGWDYKGTENRYLYTADNLRAAMTLNTHLKVFVASGLYDLVTTPFAARYILDHLGIEPELRQNLTVTEYESGHMMYMHEPSLVRMKKDLAAFYEAALARR